MSESAAALAALAAAVQLLRRGPSLPPEPSCLVQARQVFAAAPAEALPSGEVLEQLRSFLGAACAAGQIMAVPTARLRQAPLVFWDRQPFAAGFKGLVDAYLPWAEQRSRWLRTLIEAWLRDFDPAKPRLVEVGRFIARTLPGVDDPRLVPWQKAAREFRLFDAEQGPRNVAARLLRGSEAQEEVLAAIGMNDPLRAQGRFFRTTTAAMLDALPQALRGTSGEAAWRRAEPVLTAERTETSRTGRTMIQSALRFPELTGSIAASALDPWVKPPPGNAPHQPIKGFLLRTIGDPRLRPDRWSAVPEACTRLMLGWLAAASLEAFFRLISETNEDPQWRYRRAFWRACLRKMPPDRSAEVWVILGPALAERANLVRDLKGNSGRLVTAGQYGEQAAMLIRLGDIVLSEWSNVGALRAWPIRNRETPRLYRGEYDPRELRAPGMNFPDHPVRRRGGADDGKGLWHRQPESGLWQGSCAEFLRQQVGISLKYDDYMGETTA